MSDGLAVPVIDHVIVNAPAGLDPVAARYATLGFGLTARGRHSLGSVNHLAMFGTDYVELLGAEDGARAEVFEWPAGLSGLVFKTQDADALHRALVAGGVDCLSVQAFSRPVETAAGVREAAFRTVRLSRAAFGAGRLFFCQHLTPELVWAEGRAGHQNGVLGVSGVMLAAEDPAGPAALFGSLFGRASMRRTSSGYALLAGLATVEVMTPAALVARLGRAAPEAGGRREYLAALRLRAQSLERVWAEIPEARRLEGGLVVAANAACGAALLFEE